MRLICNRNFYPRKKEYKTLNREENKQSKKSQRKIKFLCFFFISLNITATMGLYARWMALPSKVRYYVGFSTIGFALVGDYVTSRINDEVQARKEIEESSSSPQSTNQ